MIVIVAEKHHQAEDIATALAAPGSLKAGDTFFAGYQADDRQPFVVVFADGHLLELMEPEGYNPAWAKWSSKDLPIVPPGMQFRYQPRNAQAQRLLNAIKYQCEKAVEIVNGCDAGREGELIFWELMRILGFPRRGQFVKRLWIQDPTANGIRNAFRRRKHGDSDEYRRMREAALLRQHADWIYGINMSRYVTLKLPPHPTYPNATFAIGRVKTPVLGLIYDATEKSRNFTESPFYRIRISLRGKQETFHALVLADAEHRYGNVDTMFADSAYTEGRAREIAIYASKWEAFDEVKEVEEFPPEPFSLVELQRACFRLFRWPAAHTLKVAQQCYAVEKSLTYPRTSSFHLPASMRAHCNKLHAQLWAQHVLLEIPHAKAVEMPEFSERYFREDKDMEDHHAIIPTGRIPSRTGKDGRLADTFILWDLVVRRFVTALLVPAKIRACSRILTFEHPSREDLRFRALLKAAVVMKPEWLAVEEAIGNCRGYGKRLIDRLQEKFPESDPVVECTKIQKVKGYTQRPEELNDDTLIGVMERLKLGTPATRAEIIEELISRDYVERRASGFLSPRGLGSHLVQELRRLKAEELLSPDLTKRWEETFDGIEKEDMPPAERVAFLEKALEKAKEVGRALMEGSASDEKIVYCPLTHKRVKEDDFQFYFDGYKEVVFKKTYIGRKMTASDWREILVANPKTGAGPFDGFRSSAGKTFSARVGFTGRRGKYGYFRLHSDGKR